MRKNAVHLGSGQMPFYSHGQLLRRSAAAVPAYIMLTLPTFNA